MSKKLYLIALNQKKNVIVRVWELCSGSMWTLKHQAENYLRKLDPGFREGHSFYVIVCEDEVNAGDPVRREKTEVCFQLI